jgi:DNA helicase IV
LFDADGNAEGANLGLSGPQVLLAALDRSRTGRMRDIVATVQREQDGIIRAPLAGILIVQGGPGTGKTAVALHRAAYLLYTHRFPLEHQGLLVVGPNPVFLRYIEHVLPSLGETGVELSTVSGLFDEARPTATEGEPVARLKGDPRMARLIAHAVGDRQRPLSRPVPVPFGRLRLQLTRSMSMAIVSAAKRRPGSHNSRRRMVENLLWRHLAGQVEGRLDRDGVEPSSEETSRLPTPDDLGRQLRQQPEVIEALDRMWPVLRPQELLHDLFGAMPLLTLAGRDLMGEETLALLFRPRVPSWQEVAWTGPDMALLDEARAVLGQPRRRSHPDHEPRAYGHIVVDEAQDLSPMQLRMLARRSLSGSMTLVGDIAQGTSGWAPRDWKQIVPHLPARRGWQQVELTVNYRTPSEIMALAGRVLEAVEPGMVPPESVRTSGTQPRVVDGMARLHGSAGAGFGQLVAGTAAEELVALSSDGAEGIVGVIVPPSLLEEVAASLEASGIPTGRRMLDSPVSILVVEEAKGLEFDSVIVVEPTALANESPQGLRALYVALTRATRRLAIVHRQELPACLQGDQVFPTPA